MPRQKACSTNPKPGGGGRLARQYRVWIVRYPRKAPKRYTQTPADAIAQEPAENDTMSARQAARYVAAFNRAALARHRRLWAVALPVAVRFEGEPQPGDAMP